MLPHIFNSVKYSSANILIMLRAIKMAGNMTIDEVTKQWHCQLIPTSKDNKNGLLDFMNWYLLFYGYMISPFVMVFCHMPISTYFMRYLNTGSPMQTSTFEKCCKTPYRVSLDAYCWAQIWESVNYPAVDC